MLRFEIQPDTVFFDMLDDAIEQMIDEMDLEQPSNQDVSFAVSMPRSSRFFTAEQAKEHLRALQRAIHAPQLYQPTDYHWLLLYECLRVYCGLFNELPSGVIKDTYGIESIDFNGVIDYFFWDIDFLNDHISDLSMEAREQLGVSPETFGLSMGLKPHPEELTLKLCEPEDGKEAAKAYTPGSKEYPDFSNVPP